MTLKNTERTQFSFHLYVLCEEEVQYTANNFFLADGKLESFLKIKNAGFEYNLICYTFEESFSCCLE